MSQDQKNNQQTQEHNRKHRPKHGGNEQHQQKKSEVTHVQGTEKHTKSGSPLKSFGRIVKRPLIKEAVKEVTAGGVVYRINSANVIEVLLAQDSRDRWTIPKGHVEPGEITSQTAEREVREETDLQEMKVYEHLGKSTFQYRRQNTLVLMTMHIFLIEARGDTAAIRTVDPWMKSIGWFEFSTALDMIQYEAIETLMLVGLRKIRERTPGAKISA